MTFLLREEGLPPQLFTLDSLLDDDVRIVLPPPALVFPDYPRMSRRGFTHPCCPSEPQPLLIVERNPADFLWGMAMGAIVVLVFLYLFVWSVQ